jgi:hypothetical protein
MMIAAVDGRMSRSAAMFYLSYCDGFDAAHAMRRRALLPAFALTAFRLVLVYKISKVRCIMQQAFRH